jgi:tRNA 2-thiouridine synthesizing protein A
MPVIRVQQRVEELPAGTRLEAICSDPGVVNDIPVWCRVNRHKLIEVRRIDEEYIVVLEVGDQAG